MASLPQPTKDQEFKDIRGSREISYDRSEQHASKWSITGFDIALISALLVVGLLLRLDFLIPDNFIVDADEAIVGLMAKHMNEGKDFPVFYYGQNYMGSFEPMLAALVFKIFGISNGALKAVPLIFSLILIAVAYLIGFELGGRRVAFKSAILTAIPPAALIVWSGKARGGFIEIVVIGALALLVCLRWMKKPDAPLRGTLLMGLLLGFGWWVNNQIIFFMLPVAFAVFSRLIYYAQSTAAKKSAQLLKHLAAGVTAFFIGGLPFWIFNIQHNFSSFGMFNRSPKSDILEHFAGLFATSIPIIFGAKHFWETNDIFPFSTATAYLLYGGALACLLYFYPKQLKDIVALKVDPQQPCMLLLLFLVVTGTVFAVSSFGHLVQAPRYLLPAYAGIFPLIALVLTGIQARSRAAGGALLACFLAFNLGSAYVGGRAIPGEPIVFNWDRVAKDHSQLITWLEQKHYDIIRTNYWIGYRLAFETEEKLKFVVFQEPHNTRIESYRQEAKKSGIDFTPLVLSPGQAAIVEAGMNALGYRYTQTTIDGYVVLYDISRSQQDLKPLPPESFSVHASDHDTSSALAIDGNLSTRWGTGRPQKPGMEFSAVFPAPRTVRGLKINIDGWDSDYPRGLRVEAISANGERKLLFDESQYGAARYYLNHDPVFHLVFSPLQVSAVVLTQTGNDPLFDWSIGEIELEQ